MKELALHLLDLMQNSLRAGATTINLTIQESISQNIFKIRLQDNGKGMNEDMVKGVINPFVTSRTHRKVGLGIPFMAQMCRECEGELKIQSKEQVGTEVVATLQYDHIDRLPLGDIAETVATLIMARPDVRYIYRHEYETEGFMLDTEDIKQRLEGVPIEDLEIIAWLKDYMREGIKVLTK